jgi:hypothetical protein
VKNPTLFLLYKSAGWGFAAEKTTQKKKNENNNFIRPEPAAGSSGAAYGL